MNAFDLAIEHTFKNEGGWANVPGDRGGATMYGITIGTLSRWRKRAVSIQEVRDLTESEAKIIYKAWYWDTLNLDAVQSKGVAMCLFDIGVVRGIGIPPKYAQRVCCSLGQNILIDGHIGPKTIAAINACSREAFINEFARLAEEGFRAIVANNPSQKKFLKGWVRRARRLLTLKVFV